MNAKKSHWLIVVLVFGVCLFLSFNRHSKSGYFNYHSEIWADKAGYYVYLPAALKFDFDPYQFPDSIERKTGEGFSLDFENSKVITKYSAGVAMLQLPFFVVADLLAEHYNMKPSGFSVVHHWFVNIAAVFYLIIGLVFLYRFLHNRFSEVVVYCVLASLFLGTNLYYYAIDETGMSHVYSFALFSIYLFLIDRTGYLSKTSSIQLFVLGVIVGLIVLIRPTNAIFLSAILFLDVGSASEIQSRFRRSLNPKVLIPVLLGAIFIFLPQLFYWNHSFGNWLVYSYTGEGFNWLNPRFLNIWFSPNNGLFLYSPFYLFFVTALVYMLKARMINGVFLAALFAGTSYLFASWWSWSYGCSFGARSYVEYLSILSIPLAYLYERIFSKNKPVKVIFFLVVLMTVVFNLKLIYTYDECYYGIGHWDWSYFADLIFSPTK